MFARSLGTGSAVFQILWKDSTGRTKKHYERRCVLIKTGGKATAGNILEDVLNRIWNRIPHKSLYASSAPRAPRQQLLPGKRPSAKRESLPADPRRAQHRLRKPRHPHSRIHGYRALNTRQIRPARPGYISVNTKSIGSATTRTK